MNKMKKRLVALLVVFTSIISFLPIEIVGQAANAATISSDATTIRVYTTGNTTALTATTDTTTSESIYTTQSYEEDGFDIVLNNVSVTQDDLLKDADTKKLSGSGVVSGIVDQKVEIVSINGTSCITSGGKAILSELGIVISESEDPNESRSTIGKKITGLPLGINKIKYKITITTQEIYYTAAETTTNGTTTTTTPATTTINDPVDKSYATQELMIYHGTEYAVSKISSMLFKAYIGSATNFDEDTDEVLDDDLKENNTIPFLYSTTAEPDSDMPLKYTFDVPDSISSLKYIMTFGQSITLDGATIYKNGDKAVEGTDYEISGSNLTGNLESLGQSDLIVVKLNSSSGTSIVAKTYAIQISYNNLNSEEDYSLKYAGITKLDYDDDNAVLAYVGKKFIVTDDSRGFKIYKGNIYIDPKATMVSIDPTLIRSKDTVGYVVTNNYVDSTGTTKVKKSMLKNGEQFIDFMTSTTSNQLQVDVYEGTNGTATDSSIPLARYLLDVTSNSTDAFALDLDFKNTDGSSDDVYLTQPGVKENDIDFSTDRRTYDLYSSDPVKVSLALKSENDDYEGIRSNKNEYIKVWVADDINSNNLEEAQASQDNDLDSNNIRQTSLDVELDGAKKLVVQAYYDEFETNDDGSIKTGTDGMPVYSSHAIGNKYVFYLPNNYDTSDETGIEDTSANAYLNSLKVTGGTLVDSDENEGFSSSVYDYITTVAKDDTTAKITAIAEDDNVESIVATINGSDSTYDLVSGEATELPLDSDGSTTVNVVVTAQDGTTIKTYSVIIKNNKKSSNVTLSNVILNVGDYTFDSTENTTKVHVSQSTTNIKVTPVPEDSSAIVTVDGTEYIGSAITVSVKGAQETDIEILVESEDGKESKIYALEVYRTDSSNWNDSSDTEDSTEDDQYYDEYYDCWVDTTKYEEWGKIGSKPAYFDKNNRQVKEAWIYTGQKLYYLNSSGYRASGWKVDDADGKTYYLDQETGEMKKGWLYLNNSWYYFRLNGVMHKGWLSLNKKCYYFTPNGQMVINQSMFIDGKVYNFGQDGAIY